MTNLQQEQYEDDNGRQFPASGVDCLGSYVHIADGFYHWTCGRCSEQHSDRWHAISGRVLKCKRCEMMNLLVRTNCDELSELWIKRNDEASYKAECERLRGIERYNKEQVQAMRAAVMEELRKAIDTVTAQ